MITLSKLIQKDELVVYHGSRGGLQGNISPISRLRCDFGKGFYMGTNPEQVKREESRNVVNDMARKHVRDGYYLSELIDNEINNKKTVWEVLKRGSVR